MAICKLYNKTFHLVKQNQLRRKWIIAFAVIFAVFGAIPLMILSPAPLADWPNHLARVSIMSDVLNGNAFWSARYSFQGLLIPNAILDAAVLSLMRIGLPISLAGSIFLLLCYIVFIVGFASLASLRQLPIIIAISVGSMLFYTGCIIFGLVNFVTGIGVAMLAASFWMRDDATIAQRFLIAVIAIPIISFCHVVAALVFGGLCGCYDLVRPAHTQRRRLIETLPASFAIIIALIGYKLSAAGSDVATIDYDGAPGIKSVLIGKIRQIAQALTSGDRLADVLLACALILIGALLWQRRREIRLSSAAPVAALALLAVLSPNGVGLGLLLDTRLFAWSLFLAIALLPWSKGISMRIEISLITIFIVRTIVLTAGWASYAPIYADVRAAFAGLPKGSTLLDAYDDTPSFYASRQPPLWNIASLAVEDGVFVPSVFAEPTQQPLAVRLEWRPLWLWSHSANARTPDNLRSVRERARRFCDFDPNTHLLLMHVTQQPPFSIEGPCKQ